MAKNNYRLGQLRKRKIRLLLHIVKGFDPQQAKGHHH